MKEKFLLIMGIFSMNMAMELLNESQQAIHEQNFQELKKKRQQLNDLIIYNSKKLTDNFDYNLFDQTIELSKQKDIIEEEINKFKLDNLYNPYNRYDNDFPEFNEDFSEFLYGNEGGAVQLHGYQGDTDESDDYFVNHNDWFKGFSSSKIVDSIQDDTPMQQQEKQQIFLVQKKNKKKKNEEEKDEEEKDEEEKFDQTKENLKINLSTKIFDKMIKGLKKKYFDYFHRLTIKEQKFLEESFFSILNIYSKKTIRLTIAMFLILDYIIKFFFKSQGDETKKLELINILNKKDHEHLYLNLDFSNFDSLKNSLIQETDFLKTHSRFPFQDVMFKVYGDYLDHNYRKFAEKLPESLMDFFNKKNINPIIEPIIQQNINPIIQPIIQQSMDTVIEPIIQQSMDSNIEPIIQQSMDPIIEPIIQQSMDVNIEPIIQQSIDTFIEPIIQQSMDSNIEPIIQQSMDPIIEPIIQQSMDSNIEQTPKNELK
jgi:hypothetical protein